MMHLSHSDNESADEVEACFLAALFGDLVLQYSIIAGYLRDG